MSRQPGGSCLESLMAVPTATTDAGARASGTGSVGKIHEIQRRGMPYHVMHLRRYGGSQGHEPLEKLVRDARDAVAAYRGN